jgi:NSS family neurotransmitter:Na+ symporter
MAGSQTEVAPPAQTPQRSSWSGKWAFILASAASAVGLGNMWRFPYLAAKYGGGTFLLVYLLLVFTVGVSLLLLETSLGRLTRRSTIGAFRHFGRRWAFIGVLGSLVPFLIAPYYCIIGGWVTKYAASCLAGDLAALADDGAFFSAFITSPAESFLWMALFMAAVFAVVSLGVKGGIEKVNLVMMPLLIVMAAAVAAYTLTIPGALEGALYYLVPDFSKFSVELVVAALGQMFFSLSLAMGVMITYGSYLDRRTSLTSSVARVGCFDVGVSFLAGLMIVPGAFAAMGSDAAVAENSGPSLMFVILPEVFASMGPMARIVASAFFVLALFAALTSAISMVETCVSIVQDGAGWSRGRSLACAFAVLAACAVLVNLGYNRLAFIEPLGEGSTLLDAFDFAANSVIMPIVALLTCVFVGWVIKPQTLVDEIAQSSPFRLRRAWAAMVKYVAPVLLAVILVAYVAAQFGLFSM